MKVQLINNVTYSNPFMQVCYNRGIKEEDIVHYWNLTDDDIESPLGLGKENLKKAATILFNTISKYQKAAIIVDCDVDGYTSSAILLNYLHRLFPQWVEQRMTIIHHSGKQHGLNDCINNLLKSDISLVICPDSSSNDYIEHQLLAENEQNCLVIDHHHADKISEYAITINNQLSNYKNKELSGAGVTWQFCRYLDTLSDHNYAEDYIDLAALGNLADMMSLLSFETKRIIEKGFSLECIHNPFIKFMLDKNEFPLSKQDYKPNFKEQAITPMGAAFFIAPFINAIARSGTQEEKELCFKAMLEYEAYKMIPEIKRGKTTGKTEYLVLQAVRMVGNVKNRQTRSEEAGMESLQKYIEDNNLLENRFLFFPLKKNQIDSEIRGLVANKLMAKYQRPCIIVTNDDNSDECCGSGRGYTKNGLDSFKNLLESCNEVNWVQGHDNAFGISIKKDSLDAFMDSVNEKMKNIPNEVVYKVDYLFNRENDVEEDVIMTFAEMNDFWGQDFERAHIGIRFMITDHNFKVMKSNTLKFTLSNGIEVIKFGGTEDEIDKFTVQSGYKEVLAYCTCSVNEWNGNKSPQLILEDYEIIDSSTYFF